MKDYLERLTRPEMKYYLETYAKSPRWKGDSLSGKTIIIYCEQGLGDTIHFARYFKYLDADKVILHCPWQLHRLMSTVEGVDEVIDKNDPNLPKHDLHVLSLSLPFVLNKVDADIPYLKANPIEVEKGFNVGIAWEGSPKNKMNKDRSCHLRYFENIPGRKFMLQDRIYTWEYSKDCDDIELYGTEMKDLQDTANLIAAMDLVVTVDTAALHLAGAMGKKTIGLLCHEPDSRWSVKEWYPSINLISQKTPGDWEYVFRAAKDMIESSNIQL